jgi:hypothetical protein
LQQKVLLEKREKAKQQLSNKEIKMPALKQLHE